MKPSRLTNPAVSSASSGLATVRADAVMPACGGHERTFTPVNSARGSLSGLK